ncbi:MAG: hypothetical protein R8G66_15680 [Cytophagales bacterium]|nr:hypothetical protein [Cytophagales bacterium]
MKKLSLLILLLVAVGTLSAQKVKYKEIFPDLEARKFNKVEPLLKRFLDDEKNSEHANAHYQMGLITEAHFLLQDIVADTAALYTYGEDALGYYRKSITLITEKELKKNDQYYQAFNRRDLRSGEFGIKMSDVHLAIEEKIATVENRIAAVRSFHQAVGELTRIESVLLKSFNGIVSNSSSYYDFLLKSDLETITVLGDMQAAFKSFDDKANETMKVGKELGAEDYYSNIEYLPVQQFSERTPKFPDSNTIIRTWQFSDWASKSRNLLNQEIFTMKNGLKSLNKQLMQATNALKSGTALAAPESIPPVLNTTLNKYDSQPLPRKLLHAKMKENAIRFLTDTTMNTMLLDSSVIAYQLGMADSIMDAMDAVDELLDLDAMEITRGAEYYPEFLQAYGGANGLKNYAAGTRSWIAGMRDYWQANKDFWFMRDNWGVTATDTIPLHVVDNTYEGDFVTKGYLDLPDNEIMTWGFKRDSVIGFVARFGADRSLVWERRFETELLYVDINYAFETDTLSSDSSQVAFYIYKELVAGESNINVVNVELAGELNWSVNAQTSRKPEYTTYSHEIGETTIFLYPQEQYPLTNGELGFLIINRDGEVR